VSRIRSSHTLATPLLRTSDSKGHQKLMNLVWFRFRSSVEELAARWIANVKSTPLGVRIGIALRQRYPDSVRRWPLAFWKISAEPPFPGRFGKKHDFSKTFGVTKSIKNGPMAFPKRASVGTYQPRPQGLWGHGLPSQEASGRERRPRALTRPFRFFGSTKDLSRGGAAR
jgi:hypothetical protein